MEDHAPGRRALLGAAAGEEHHAGLAGETVWMVEAVTERKATEAQLARAREELENRVRAAHDELAWTNERLVAEMYERSEVEERARRTALYDHWTGLPNRRLLESRLDEA